MIHRLAALSLCFALPSFADDEGGKQRRKEIAERLFDPKVGDEGAKWGAVFEACGMGCDIAAYGGCTLVEGAVDCEVHVISTDRKPQVITVRAADRDPAALEKGRAELITAINDIGYAPVWLEEHRFETPALDVTTQNVTFRWNWKKATLVVLDGKKAFKTVKAPKLRKELGVTSVAIWFKGGEEPGFKGVLRVRGEGDEGQSGDAVVVVPLPPFR